jgi:branched-chain amino acid transport system substrate-binding protein
VCPAAAVLASVLVVLVTGCGDGKTASTRIASDTLTIYTGLPLRGERAAEGRAVLRGQKLALDEAGGRVADLSIGLIALDDTKTATGRWDPGQVAANARQAAENPTTIAYIGDLDSGATAVSLPITNEIGVLHVSPLSGYTGLTRPADKGEPAKYYPSAVRTFARLVPTGAHEARALTGWIGELGFARVTLAYDGLQEGLGQGSELERALQAGGIEVVDVVRVEPGDEPLDLAGHARDIVADAAPALVYAGASTPTALALMKAVHDRDPGEALIATSGVADPDLAGGLGAAERQVRVISPLLPLDRRPAPAQRMARRYQELFGAAPPPAALYGYEAMRSVLDAIRRAGQQGNDRRAVIGAYLPSSVPSSVLGSYAIGPRGDTGATSFGAFRVRAGRLAFQRLLVADAN